MIRQKDRGTKFGILCKEERINSFMCQIWLYYLPVSVIGCKTVALRRIVGNNNEFYASVQIE